MISNTVKKLNPLKKIGNKAFKKDAKIFPICEYVLNFDGSSKGNPGLAGAGMVIYKNNQEIWSSCKFLGCKTNNQSEYSALILGLKAALSQDIDSLCVLGDSLLVINQVNGVFKVNSELLRELHTEVIELKAKFKYIEFNHVYREYNKRADELSNLALENVDSKPSEVIETKKSTEIMDTLVEDLGIVTMDEDWIEEIKLEKDKKSEPTKKQKNVLVKIPSAKKIDEPKQTKQSAITQFFKINPLFPDI
jgi:ribonuclease HI